MSKMLDDLYLPDGKRLRARRETRIEKAEREVFGNDRGE